MKKQNNPCFNCNDRHAGCHGSCKAYLDWHEQHVQEKKIELVLSESQSKQIAKMLGIN